MTPGYPEDVPLFSPDMLEGEYVAWTLVWVRDLPGASTAVQSLVDNYGNVYFVDSAIGINMNTRNYAGVEVLGLTEHVPFSTVEMSFSANRKYVITYDNVGNVIFRVWRRLVNIFSRDASIDHGNLTQINNMSMSPNGKFIAFSGDDSASGADKLIFLYEGL